ncbi:MAG: hypothetical protein OSJ60_01985 [Lachnospiraceae bacterium]|nr:hypothetical protein C819_02228 [Lachnospiraceae bacterium 10-1]MCX4350383.1 hypothetical protein [Lachnospiraceae bacterium]
MRKSGINSNTPNDFLLGAGVVFKNFKYVYKKVDVEEQAGADEIKLSQIMAKASFIGVEDGFTPKAGDFVVGAWNDSEENVLGATSGGNKLSIVPEITPIEVDGAVVEIKGLNQKTGESGTLEVNLAQHTLESIKRAIVGKEVESLIPGYNQIQTKSLIELSDYLDNIAYVGSMTDGTEIVAILENAICSSGLEMDAKNKETSVVKTVFKATADFKSGVYDTLPVYIFYPDKTGKSSQSKIYQIVEG